MIWWGCGWKGGERERERCLPGTAISRGGKLDQYCLERDQTGWVLKDRQEFVIFMVGIRQERRAGVMAQSWDGTDPMWRQLSGFAAHSVKKKGAMVLDNSGGSLCQAKMPRC